MFGFFKQKLKETIDKFTKKVDKEEESKEKVKVEEKIQVKEKVKAKESVEVKEHINVKEDVKEHVKVKEKEHKAAETKVAEAKIAEARAAEAKAADHKKTEEKKSQDFKEAEIKHEAKVKESKPEIKVEFQDSKIEKPVHPIKVESKITDKKEQIAEVKDIDKFLGELEGKEFNAPKVKAHKLEDKKVEDKQFIKEVEHKEHKASKEKLKELIQEEAPKGLFGKLVEKITTQQISEDKFDEFFEDLEMVMLENNVALQVIDKIKDDLKKAVVNKPIKRGKIAEVMQESLRSSIEELFIEGDDLLELIKSNEKPFVIVFVGINGSGKTTTIAKLTHMLIKNKKSVVIAAADTFRAAAIQQLEEHANKLGVKLIKHDYGADPAAVAFDAVKHAKATGKDVVLVDTAGRLQSNTNLIEEMKKISRVVKPNMKIFVGESIAGNDFINQAQEFDKAIGIDGIILSKADIDEKGGAAISVSYVTKKPILYMGMGQSYDDLVKFDSSRIVEGLDL